MFYGKVFFKRKIGSGFAKSGLAVNRFLFKKL